MATLEIPSYLTIFQLSIIVSIFTVILLVVFSAILRARLTDLEKWRFGVTLAVTGFAWLLGGVSKLVENRRIGVSS